MLPNHATKRKSQQPAPSAARCIGTPYGPYGLTLLEDILVLVTLLAAPQVMGGRTDLGRLAYVIGVCLLGLTWLARQAFADGGGYRSTGVEWLLAAGALVLTLQVIPLPPDFMKILAPYQTEWLPLWTDHAGVQALAPSLGGLQWDQISLAPDLTRIALIVYVAHASLFLILCQRLRSLDDVERLLKLLALAVIGMASIGLVQYLVGTEKFLGIFVHPSRVASEACSGPFSNPNHFAHFLAIGVGAVIIWLQQSMIQSPHYGPTGNRRLGGRSRDGSHVVALMLAGGLTLLLLAGFLTRSRGGMLAIALAVLLTVAHLSVRKLVQRSVIITITAVMLLFGTGLFIHGKDQVQEELDTLTSGSIEAVDAGHGRRNIWMANVQTALQSPLLGMGVGTHPFVYPKYFDHPTQVEYSHAESCYVQLFTETGCLGVGLVLFGLLSITGWLWQAGREHLETRALVYWIAVIAGIVTSCAHAAIDFPWYLTSCMSLGIVLAATAWSLAQLARHDAEPTPLEHSKSPFRLKWLLLGTVVSVAAVPAVYFLSKHAIADIHWNDYLVNSLDKEIKREKRALLVSHTPEEQQKWRKRIAHRDAKMFQSLEQVLQWTPSDCRANLRMASLLLRIAEEHQLQSDNAMGLAQIRDAAIQSNFPNVEQQRAWLAMVLGDDIALLDKALYHARQALFGCPLEAEGYLLWKELAILRDTRREVPNLLLAQAARVRPHDANVLFAIGREAVMLGKISEALPYWRKAFHLDEESAIEIIRIIGPQVAGDVFIEMFAPKERELTTLTYYYYKVGQPENMKKILPVLIAMVEDRAAQETGDTAARTRLRMVEHYTTLGDATAAAKQARLAVEAAPNMYEPHYVLAMQLVKVLDFSGAVSELSWCSRRRPRDARVQELLTKIKQMRQPGRNIVPVSHMTD